MHELVRISIDKWYALEGMDLDVNGAIAVIGPTGSGKSAVLDCIQTVMTGNNQNFLDLNASAGEHIDRTVRSYCLGAISDVDQGLPQRDRAETTLALVFRDAATGICYTIGLLLRASKDDPREDTTRFIVRGHLFSIRDYVERNAAGQEYVIGHDAIVERLKTRYGKSVTFHNSTAMGFVAEYLSLMRPKMTPEPNAFVRSIWNAASARKIKTPTDFVRKFVLAPKPLNVERMRVSIKNWKQLEARAIELEQEIREIRAVRGRFATWARQLVQAQTDRFIEAHAERLRVDREVSATVSRIADLEQKIADLEHVTARYKENLKQANEDVLHKKSLIAASGGALALRKIEVEEKSALDDRRRAVADLEAAIGLIAGIARLDSLRPYLPIRLHPALESAAALTRIAAGGELETWASRGQELAALALKVESIGQAVGSLKQQRDARIADLRASEARINDLREAIGRADAGGPLLSRHVRLFMAELEAIGIRSKPLPDLVEITDESWSEALEMILGANREALLVDDLHLDRAFDLLWKRRNEFHGCRIINTRKTTRAARRRHEDSIATIVATDNPHVRAFIDREAGRWIMAETEGDLELHDRAIMRNGKATAGFSLRVHQNVKPILGRTAQVFAAESARAELAQKAAEHRATSDEYRMIEAGIRAVEAVSRQNLAVGLSDAADRVSLAQTRLKSLKRDRDAVEDDRTRALREDVEALAEDIQRCEEQLNELAEEDRAARIELGLAKERLEDERKRAAELAETEKNLEAAQQSQKFQDLILHAGAGEDSITVQKQKLSVDLELHQKGREREFLAETRIRARQRAGAAENAASENGRRAMREMSDYVNRRLDGRSPLPAEAEEAAHFIWCVDKEKRLEEHELRPYRQQVAAARQEVERSLKDDLLSKLHERFEMVKTQTDQLNRRLQQHVFVGQRYSFSRWVAADYKPLYEVARRIGNDSIGDLSAAGAGIAEEDLKKVLEQIDEIIVNEEEARRLEDYRNYFEFELNLHAADNPDAPPQALSKVIGLLSGGQRQAPYYVAIAASMVSVCFPQARERGTAGVGLVTLDEAFNKLDISNTQQLINLYRDLGLQMLIAAPESARPTFLEVVDCVVSVARQGDQVMIDVERIGEKAKHAMRAENPEHKGIEGFRRDIALFGRGAEAAE